MIGETNENMEITSGKTKGKRLFLIVSAGVLLAALAVVAVFVFGTSGERVERVLDFHTVMSGVSVNGVDISGLTEEEARTSTEGIAKELLGANSFAATGCRGRMWRASPMTGSASFATACSASSSRPSTSYNFV